MKKILLTGFGPFKDHDTNPSEEIVRSFTGEGEWVLERRILDVKFATAQQNYYQMLEDIRPDFIVNVGLKSGSGVISLERFAINAAFDSDEAFEHFDIEKTGTAALTTQLDVDLMAKELCLKGIPTLRSNFAGTYLCNYVYYQSLYWCKQYGGDALFMHIPYTTEIASYWCWQKKKAHPSLPQEMILKALGEVLEGC